MADLSLRDRFKQARRAVRYWLVLWVVRLIESRPATVLPRLKRLLLKVMPLFFAREMNRARGLLPVEFAPQSDKILSGMVQNQVSSLLEVFLYEKLLAADPQFIRVEGKEHLDAARKAGRGIIILSGHYGSWELVGYTLIRLGFDLHAIARPQALNAMTELINGFRERRGLKMLMENNLPSALKLLRKGGVVGIVSDLNARERGYRVTFFGREASFYHAPIILAERTGAGLFPVSIERQADGRHLIRIDPELSWDNSAHMVEKVQVYARAFERIIRRRPDHWVWFHERYQHAELGRTA